MKYSIHTNAKYGPLVSIDVAHDARSCTERWWNQTLCYINDCVARLCVIEGEFHWHKHDQEDEFFFVLEGELLLDLEDRTEVLNVQQGILVPRGVLHRTRASQRTVLLVFEAATVTPTGD